MKVKHTTRYHYEAPVFASYNEARISPLDTPSQFTLEHRVEVQPAANLFRYRDYWGSRVHAFDLHHEHTELEIVGTSLVETAERTPSLDTSVTWAAIDAPGMIDRFYEYLGSTPVTEPDDAIREVAGTSHRLPSGPLHDAAEVARAGVPTVMLFVQSLRGLSHTKLEDTRPEHLEVSVAALDRLAAKTIDWIAAG